MNDYPVDERYEDAAKMFDDFARLEARLAEAELDRDKWRDRALSFYRKDEVLPVAADSAPAVCQHEKATALGDTGNLKIVCVVCGITLREPDSASDARCTFNDDGHQCMRPSGHSGSHVA